MFSGPPITPRYGFFKEDEYWDCKAEIPPVAKGNEAEWADIAADVLAFHNARGGVLIFGIRDKDFHFVGATNVLNQKQFNDKLRRYIGDRFWVSFSWPVIQPDQRYLGMAIVPARSYTTLRAMADSPAVEGKSYLETGDLCVRIGDETRIMRGSGALEYEAAHTFAVLHRPTTPMKQISGSFARIIAASF